MAEKKEKKNRYEVAWEESSRLSEQQHALVKELGEIASEPPLPPHLVDEKSDERDTNVPFSPLKVTTQGSGQDVADDFEKIEDMQQFYTWFDGLQSTHALGSEEQFVNYRAVVEGHKDLCDGIIGEMDAALHTLDRLETEYGSVAVKSGQLHNACEELVSHQERLIEFSDTVATAMDHFNQLDIIAAQLASPSCSVLDASFFSLLNRLDECLEFLNTNSTFKESGTYTTKFKHLQSRALTMVKTYIISSLRSTSNQLQSNRVGSAAQRGGGGTPTKTTNGEGMTKDADVSVANVKFRALAVKLRPLCEAIEKRAAVNASYKGLLADCHSCYVQQRKVLISPSVSASTAAIIASSDIRTALRTGCTFLLRTCVTEHQLFSEFFEPSISAMRGLLEAFAGEVYQTFRPMFIRNRDYVTLCACIELLRDEVLDDKLTTSMSAIQWVQGTVQRMIGDIQERVAFLGQMYIQDAIINYVPSAEVLNYPDVLPPLGSGKHAAESWYPVVQQTLRFLSHLYQAIDSKIFEDLAQEAVSECSLSLGKAAEAIKANKGDIHSHLFLVRHLMLLREQISPFEIEFCVEERNLDFSQMKGAFRTFVEGISGSGFSSLFSLSRSNSLISLMGSTPPRVKSKRVDSKRALEKALREATDAFLTDTVKPLFEDVSQFLTVARAFVSVQQQHARQGQADKAKEESGDEAQREATVREVKKLCEQDFAEAGKLRAIVQEMLQKCEEGLPAVSALVRRYMPHAAGIRKMDDRIMEFAWSRYSELVRLVREHYGEEEQRVIGVPSQEAQKGAWMELLASPRSPPPHPSPSSSPSSSSSSSSSLSASPSSSPSTSAAPLSSSSPSTPAAPPASSPPNGTTGSSGDITAETSSPS
eukprot:TRINITY_DN2875_c0_g1_i2.p1 TRINITY_DN2875_c0_g1~~TRINITY_DN2875_c0_g1_i2.p1  ORF type:complete len:886 (+),score=203.84 TRINITY_DN2875_c0_g1_i2:36-2660(+)